MSMSEVEQLRNKAIGYVWGLMDARDVTVWGIVKLIRDASHETWDVSYLFSQAYAEHVRDGSVSYQSIRDAWESWARHGLIFGWWDTAWRYGSE